MKNTTLLATLAFATAALVTAPLNTFGGSHE